jgi:hypothetical protein
MDREPLPAAAFARDPIDVYEQADAYAVWRVSSTGPRI